MPEIAELVISPDRASVPVGTQVDFAVAALTAESHTGSEVQIDWASTAAAVFTVEQNGRDTGKKPGSAFCTVGLRDDASPKAGRSNRVRIPIGLDSAVVHIF